MLQNQISSLKAFSVQRNVKLSCPELLPAVDLSGPRIRPVGIQSDVSASLCSLDFEKVAHLLLSDTNPVYLPVFTIVGESL